MQDGAPVRLETQRLVVLLPPAAHASLVADYYERNRTHLEPWEPRRPTEFYDPEYWTRRLSANHGEFAQDRSLRLVLMPRDGTPRVIGTANFSELVRGSFQACFLGYSLDGELQGRGLMQEALECAIGFVFSTMNLHRVMANYRPDNHRSARLLTRLGFEREGFAKDYLMIDGQWRDHVLTARTNADWLPADASTTWAR